MKQYFQSSVKATAGISALAMMLIAGCAVDKASTSAPLASISKPGAQWQKIQSKSTQPVAIRYFGFLDVTLDEDGESQYFEAGFARFEIVAPLGVLLDSFRQPAMDSCEYHQKARGDSTPLELKDELELPGYPYEFVGAGSTIDVFVGNRGYTKLKRTSSDTNDAVQYETDVGSLPLSWGGFKFGDLLLKTRRLQIASTGDVFPSFSGIEVPPVEAVKRFKPNKYQRVTADTNFLWHAGGNKGDPDARVQIEAGGGGRAIFCAVADDGAFQLPEEVKIQLHDASIPNPSAYRDAVWFYLHNDALLIVSQSSYY